MAALAELRDGSTGEVAAAARLVTVLLARSDHADATVAGDPADLLGASPGVIERVRRRIEVRFLLDLAPGVVGRSALSPTSLLLLRSEMVGEREGPDAALDVLSSSGDDSTTVALRVVALLAGARDHGAIVRATDGLTNVDDGTALLLVARGAAAGALGRHDDAAQAFAEALRLPRRSAAIRQRALLVRASVNDGRGHRGRALADLRRARETGDPVDGLDRAVRSLQQRR